MLSKIWNWVVRGFRRLFGRNEPASPPPPPSPPRQTLSDAELEAIFMQLLDGVNEGWSRGSVKGFLIAKRVTDAELIAWLRRLEERLQTMPAQHEELARRLVKFGEIRGEKLGEVAAEIGRHILGQIPQQQEIKKPEEKTKGIEEAEAWFNRGNEQYMNGDFLAALASYDKAVVVKPDLHEAWNNRGGALIDLGRYEEAVASYDKALKIKLDDDAAWYNRGIALRDLGRTEEAIASWDKAVETKPNFHQPWFNRGIALYHLGRTEEAIASWNKAVEIKPDLHDAWYNRGGALIDLGRYEQAITSFDKAVEIKPDLHDAWYGRGNALDDLGRYEQAIASFDKAVEIKPDLHDAWNNRGTALDNLGRYEQAVASFDKAVEIKPDLYVAWINRGTAAGQIDPNRTQTPIFQSRLTLQNPHLNRRGYEGQLISYQEGLKYCKKDTHPEGWGLLHYKIGETKYYRGRADLRRRRELWGEARESYNTALQTLTETAYPEGHLQVVNRLIAILRGFGETEIANELVRKGSDLLRRLVRDCKSPRKKKQLQLKFAGFNQLTVDLHVQEGKPVLAWEVAEEGKNACLTWLLDPENENIPPPNYAKIQQLLNPSTAAVYWHQSPAALHTFILKHDAPEPIVLGAETEEAAFLKLLDFEEWLTDWNQQYTAKNKGSKHKEQNLEWKDALPEKLCQLSAILKISDIFHELNQCADIHQLILIPHRDLHRFPLHTLFLLEETFAKHCTFTYLPSAQFGLKLRKKTDKILSKNDPILSLENPPSTYIDIDGSEKRFPPLSAAEIESEIICQMFANTRRIQHNQVTLETSKTVLQQPYSILQFTGHGFYEFSNPAASALCLTGTELLTVQDIINLDLSHYKLVGLSACETAVTGNQTITNEYVGLVSAFLRANVYYVLSTLWPIRSDSSALFMIYFYQQCLAGTPEPVALVNAQNWLRSVTREDLQAWYQLQITNLPENKKVLRRYFKSCIQALATIEDNQPFNHPYYWAAFTLAGL